MLVCVPGLVRCPCEDVSIFFALFPLETWSFLGAPVCSLQFWLMACAAMPSSLHDGWDLETHVFLLCSGCSYLLSHLFSPDLSFQSVLTVIKVFMVEKFKLLVNLLIFFCFSLPLFSEENIFYEELLCVRIE